MSNLENKRTIFKNIVFIFFILVALTNYFESYAETEEEENFEEIYRGKIVKKWFSYLGNITEAIDFRKDNTVDIEVINTDIISGKTREREKLYAKGKWQINKDRLIIEVVESDIDYIKMWEKDSISFFKIVELSDELLKIASAKGIEKKFFGKPPEVKIEDCLFSIPLRPFIVNFKQVELSKYPEFLCIVINLMLSNPLYIENTLKIPDINPQIREAILFYLSSLRYEEIYKLDKLQNIEKDIYKVIKPYVGNTFDRVEIKEVSILRNQVEIQSFLLRQAHRYKDIIKKKKVEERKK